MKALLRDHDFDIFYSTDETNVAREFYDPALSRSVAYDRAVGYFRSSVFGLMAYGLGPFVDNDGRIRLLASPHIARRDADTLQSILTRPNDAEAALRKALRDPIPSHQDSLGRFAWLLKHEVLTFRIALRRHEDGSHALFHEKIGVFIDGDDWITFTGSPNETFRGLSVNAESFPVHHSWEPGHRPHAEREREQFERTWSGRRPGVRVFDYTNWLQSELSKDFPPIDPRTGSPDDPIWYGIHLPREEDHHDMPSYTIPVPAVPSSVDLHDYQNKAIENWLEQRGRGIFAMATGTGKTFTALATACRAVGSSSHIKNGGLLVLVIVPLADLVEQWAEEARLFGFRPVTYTGSSSAQEKRDVFGTLAYLSEAGGSNGMLVTTADSLSNSQLRASLHGFGGEMLVIGDEVHSLGTDRRLAALPPEPLLTLGLSATPRRHRDDEGTEALLDYFGAVCQTVTIKDAIETYKTLVKYEYYPIRIYLEGDELEEYRRLSVAIAAARDEDTRDAAIRKRTRLTSHAQAKFDLLRQLMSRGYETEYGREVPPLENQSHQIVYVAEGINPLEADAAPERAITKVTRMLGNEFNMRVRQYTSETPKEERAPLQQQLNGGELDALVAMKCLDEGVDIKEARIAVIMASTQNPRQFVQRRGRVLRTAEGKEKAIIIDMLVVPPPPDDDDLRRSEQTLVGNEISRARDLAGAAVNADTAVRRLDDILFEYDLHDYILDELWTDQ
jgi:superfamily II DNA or RNA helicase